MFIYLTENCQHESNSITDRVWGETQEVLETFLHQPHLSFCLISVVISLKFWQHPMYIWVLEGFQPHPSITSSHACVYLLCVQNVYPSRRSTHTDDSALFMVSLWQYPDSALYRISQFKTQRYISKLVSSKMSTSSWMMFTRALNKLSCCCLFFIVCSLFFPSGSFSLSTCHHGFDKGVGEAQSRNVFW